ncbi:MAG TPA: hypothetical protein PLR98_11970 [Chitinophagaceae bacterium]|nr:hypothetical protein [Chitinophagaceae bacterium]
MDPPKPVLLDPYSLIVINEDGKLKQLFVPIKVQVVLEDKILSKDSWVLVYEVQPHIQHRLLFRIGCLWYPYHFFRITANF